MNKKELVEAAIAKMSETGKLTADELAYVNEISRVVLVAVRIVRSPEAALRAIDAI